MDSNTLYYTFSVIPQVTGTIAGITIAFIQILIVNLREHLIGDGQSVLYRWGKPGYSLPEPENQKQNKKLKDAIARKNISEIKSVISKLADNEKKEGHSLEDRPTGLINLFDRFSEKEDKINQIKKISWKVFIFSLITIITSILSLATTHLIYSNIFSYYGFLILNVILFIGSLFLTLFLLKKLLFDK